jgi:hypothetical protein
MRPRSLAWVMGGTVTGAQPVCGMGEIRPAVRGSAKGSKALPAIIVLRLSGQLWVLGWSTTAMASRYTHVITPIHNDLASRLDGLLWSSKDAAIGTN